MKCAAPVQGNEWGITSTRFRKSGSLSRRCQREGHVLLGGKWFCYQHAPAWSVHYSIVERIRGFKNRDILDR